MRHKLLALVLCLSMACTGCASLGDNQALVATLILNQIEATLDSVEVAIVELKGAEADPEVLRMFQVTVKIAKPQIIAWIDTLAQIKAAGAQYDANRAENLLKRADAVILDIETLNLE